MSADPNPLPDPVPPRSPDSQEQARPAGLLGVRDLMRLPEPRILVEGLLLHSGAFGILYGQPGQSKTFAALDIALCVATGCPWAGKPTVQGPVIYVCGESLFGMRR